MFLDKGRERKNRAKPVRLAPWKGVEAYATPADKLTAVFSSVEYTPALHPYEMREQALNESAISVIICRETFKRSHGSA